ncbi:T9SS type A sorting domain-containing protein [bacterium]|nr:T9SS type A sorting domain-containing protein [bacterium]
MKRKLFILAIMVFMVPMIVLPQLHCLYVSTIGGMGALNSEYFINKFTDWGYTMDIIGQNDLSIYFPEDLEPYDFIFIDEVVSSGSLEASNFLLEPHPVPIVTTENYAIRNNILGYCNNTQATNIPAEPIKIVNGDHHMAAGFATNENVTINTGGGANEDLIPNLPEIDFIPIGQSTSLPDLYVVYGVEAGNMTVNGIEMQNRGAIVGFHENGFAAINDNGYAFIKAAVEWATEGGSAVETEVLPDQYALSQNYPNPFNPETTIHFHLAKAGHTILTVYNALGQFVTTLVDEDLSDGLHHVNFQADQLQSGVYYYKLQSGDFSEMKKMVVLK